MHRQLRDAPPILEEGLEHLIVYENIFSPIHNSLLPILSIDKYGNCPDPVSGNHT